MSEGAICVICYEDARPLCEDLQSISACGHVFHELCLQQWIEYCPAGRKPTCPLCKKSCTSRDVHRLYFQSAVADSTQPPSENLQTPVADPNQVYNSPALRKLECQLAAAKTTVQNRNEQLKELDTQVVANLRRAESAEAANVVVRELLVHCKKSLARAQEELKCCLNERATLQEKNQSMANDLAAHKLVADTDLGEEEILRLGNYRHGTNSEAFIETLTKSLILRNKSYKELMARCNELGMGESRALRKFEKTSEQLKKTKARVQELEKILEEKDHACLRDLSKSSSKTQGDDRSANRPLNNQTGSKRINAPRISLSDRPASDSTVSRVQDIDLQQDIVPDNLFNVFGSRQNLEVVPRAELPEVQLPIIVRERGLMGIEHVQPTCPQNGNTSGENFSSRKRSRSEEKAAGPDIRKDNEAKSTGFSFWVIKSKRLLQEIKMLNESKSLTDSEMATGGQRALTPSSVAQKSFPRPGVLALPRDDGSAAASSSICINQPNLISPRIEHKADTEVFGTAPENSNFVNKSIMPTANTYIGFAKRASSGERPSTSSSTFIVSGADGRGGRVTVFKPPSLSPRGMSTIATQKMKKQKIFGTGSKGRQGSLQIEHFFGRTKS